MTPKKTPETIKARWRLNSLTEILAQITTIVCSFIVARLLILTQGAGVHGLINSLASLIGFIPLIEYGIGTAIRKALRQPLVKDRPDELSAVYHTGKRCYRKVGLIALLLITVIVVIYPLIIADEFDFWYVAILVIAMTTNVVVKYFFVSINTLLIRTDLRLYVLHLVTITKEIIKTIIYYVLIMNGCSIQVIKITITLTYLIEPIIYAIYVKTHYPLHRAAPQPDLIPNRYETGPQYASNFILSHADVTILTLFASLSDVSIYAVYYLVAKYINMVIQALFRGCNQLYGHYNKPERQADLRKTYKNVSFLSINLAAICFAVMIVMIDTYVTRFTRDRSNLDFYNRLAFGIVLMTGQWLGQIRRAQMQLLMGTGEYRQHRVTPVIEATIAVVVSIIGVLCFGLIGVAIGWLAATLYRVIQLTIFYRQHLVEERIIIAVRRYLPGILTIAAAIVVAVFYPVSAPTWGAWFLTAGRVGLIGFAFNFLLNLIFNPARMKHYFNFNVCVRKVKNFTMMLFRGRLTAWRQLKRYQANPKSATNAEYLRVFGKVRVGYYLNLKHPQTLVEKLNWLKIKYTDPRQITMADKAQVKVYVAEQIGTQYVIPTLGVWERFDDIDWAQLPDEVVLKCTHDSGSTTIIDHRAKRKLCWRENAKNRLAKRLNRKFWEINRELLYREIPPRIIAEPYLPALAHPQAIDYHVFCLNGRAEYVDVRRGFGYRYRRRGHKLVPPGQIFDRDFQPAPWHYRHARPLHGKLARPEHWDQLLTLSETLAQNLPFVRVDWYLIDQQLYFSELTFFPTGGFMQIAPREWDLRLGQKLELPDGKH